MSFWTFEALIRFWHASAWIEFGDADFEEKECLHRGLIQKYWCTGLAVIVIALEENIECNLTLSDIYT